MSVISFGLMDEMMTDKDHDFYKELGERIAQLRKEHGLTQVQLAKLLGISQQLMTAHERGTRKVPVSMLPKLSKIFGMTIDELLENKQAPVKRGPVAVLNRQVEQIRMLPRTKQKFVMEMLDTVIRQQGS